MGSGTGGVGADLPFAYISGTLSQIGTSIGYATAVNDSRHVVGRNQTRNGLFFDYNTNTITDVPRPATSIEGWFNGVNNKDEAVGYAWFGGGNDRAFEP